MSKSIDQVWREMQQRRQAELQRQAILERQIEELTGRIATAIDLPEKEFRETKKPLIDVTTSSLESYKYYLSGLSDYERLYYHDAKDNFARSILLDSTFAMAHERLAATFHHLQYLKERDVHIELAKRYRSKVTPREQRLSSTTFRNLICSSSPSISVVLPMCRVNS